MAERYDYAGRGCSGGPTVGITKLREIVSTYFPGLRKRSDSVYNCRSIGGTGTPSLHGVGRAVDIFPRTKADGDKLASFFLDNYRTLNVQCIIWYRKIWSAVYPRSGWRDYGGSNPHVDHVHVELNKLGGQGDVSVGGLTPVASVMDSMSLGGWLILIGLGWGTYYLVRKL